MNALGTKSYRCVYEKLLVVLLVLLGIRLKVCVHFKKCLIWLSMPTRLPLFYTICPQRLNRVSGRLKKICKGETRYHKPLFSI